jgi:hypothetical protein
MFSAVIVPTTATTATIRMGITFRFRRRAGGGPA